MTTPADEPRTESLPTVAVITMARDEGEMLGRWTRYYADQVGAEHLYVIDDHSADGSTDGHPGTVIRPPYLTKKSFEPSRMQLISGLSNALLAAYDAVLFTDTDEFVVADPRTHASLRHFVAARHGSTALGVMTLNVIHHVGHEPDLDPGQPILGQRRYAKFVPVMCKPSLKWETADWVAASHGITIPFTVDPELYMFHMKFADRAHLERVAAHRHQLFESENRAARTSWERPSDTMVALLDEVAAGIDPGTTKQFGVPHRLLPEIVEEQGRMWRAVGSGQVPVMRRREAVRIPRRFHGLV